MSVQPRSGEGIDGLGEDIRCLSISPPAGAPEPAHTYTPAPNPAAVGKICAAGPRADGERNSGDLEKSTESGQQPDPANESTPFVALVMPFYRRATAADREHIDLVHDVIGVLADNGVCHDDVHWRHVGFYKEADGTLKAVLFDLGWASLSEGRRKEELAAAMRRALKHCNSNCCVLPDGERAS